MIKFIAILLITSSCTLFVKNTDDKYFEQIDNKTKSDSVSIVFSHNINGETHPCGCRNHPLGGLPQVAGQVHALKNKQPVIYVDSGDALFPSPKVPAFLRKSISFTADKIAESFDSIGLKYFTPGDQDFALGEDFLIRIAQTHKFEFLMTNASEHNKIKHKKWALHKFADNKIIFLGTTRKDLLPKEHRHLFISSQKAITKIIEQLNDKLGNIEDYTIVLLSHSGLDFDRELAKKFKQIDWIIGAHSQSFIRYTEDINNAKITQVLARNHYLGHIKLPANPNGKHQYEILEMRDAKKDLLPNNPMISWLADYKNQLDKIQLQEQDEIAGVNSDEIVPIPTANSCIECHSPQTKFWQSTAHSLAYVTLEKAKAHNNPNCIECHSVGFKKVDGFTHTKSIVKIDKSKKDKYWNEWSKIFSKVSSPRSMKSKTISKLSQKWAKLDKKFNVEHNYSNVQCLNCHSQPKDHPFNMDEPEKKVSMRSMCVKCHTADQSPEWYNKDSKGLATSLNKKYFAKQLKKVACPK